MSRVRIIRTGSKIGKPEMSLPPLCPGAKRVLNTGSGFAGDRGLHHIFQSRKWDELRLDINPAVSPHIVGSIVDLKSVVSSSSVDAIWCSHNIEHLHEHEVPSAFLEFRRILKRDGFLFLTCPDLEEIARLLVERGLETEIYTSPAGPIRVHDMIYGHSMSITQGNSFMCHKTGFTVDTMGRLLLEAGFHEARIAKGRNWDLWIVGFMPATDQRSLAESLSRTTESFLFDKT